MTVNIKIGDMTEFNNVKPLAMSLLRASVSTHNDYVELRDPTEGSILVLNIVEARALRDWLSYALPESTQ